MGNTRGKYIQRSLRIALLTDFGTRDPYVAAMKGVIAARTDAPIHDLTHDVEPFDVFAAAWFVKTIAPWWPRTIVVCVVDPGVGTSRRIVALSRGDQLFLAPDNGVLTMLDGGEARSIENEALFLPQGSTTFHGRDRFAPVAAALANGLAIEELGPPLRELVRLDYTPPTATEGTIVSIDRFGNAITDLVAAPISALHIGAHTITRVARTYGEAGAGAFVIIGSTGLLEISIANGSAAEVLGLKRGDRVSVTPSRAASP